MPIPWVIEAFVCLCVFYTFIKIFFIRNREQLVIALLVKKWFDSLFLISTIQFHSCVCLQSCVLIYYSSELSNCSHLIFLLAEHSKVLDEFFLSVEGKLIIS